MTWHLIVLRTRIGNVIPRFRRGAVVAWAWLVYAIGSILLPAAHVSFHADDHDHLGGGIRYHQELPELPEHHGASHEHEHESRSSRHSHEEPPSSDAEHHPSPSDSNHGDGSFFHFAGALSDSPASLVRLTVIETPTPLLPTRRDRKPFSALSSPDRPRGPPSSLRSC